MTRRLLTVKQTAEYLGLKASTLYEWTSQKRIRHLKLGSRIMFDQRDLDKLIEQCKRHPDSETTT